MVSLSALQRSIQSEPCVPSLTHSGLEWEELRFFTRHVKFKSNYKKYYFKKLEKLRVRLKGQVTIPEEVRERYGIKEGDLLQLETGKDSIILRLKPLPEPGRPVGIEEQRKILRELKKLRETWQ